MNQVEILRSIKQYQHPLLDSFAAALTFLGNEEFYFLLVPLIYWCISKRAGFEAIEKGENHTFFSGLQVSGYFIFSYFS